MGYRGSKSNKGDTLFVKEQRADGNCIGTLNKYPMLRCALVGFERNYQTRNLSKELNIKGKRFYSTSENRNSETKIYIDPLFLTGLIDGEGCFRITLTKVKRTIGFRMHLFFQINLHKKDRELLESIREYLGVGKIHDSGINIIQYRIQNTDELSVIIKHLENYPLITQKRADYELFKEAYDLILKKEHLNKEGLLKIVSLKASLNLGLSDQLKEDFPNVTPAKRLTSFSKAIRDPNWLAGFVSAEGCFMVGIRKSAHSFTGYQAYLSFIITQHIRDELLMQSIISYLGCGKLKRKRDVYELQVLKFSDITDNVFTFFGKYPILGEKAKDYYDFSLAADFMKNKEHLTAEGIAKIRTIKEGMNRGREDNL